MFFFNNLKDVAMQYIWKLSFLVGLVYCPMISGVSENYKHENGSKVSLIIPCHPEHARYLYDLLKWYEHQTVLPDEIVISLSEFGAVSNDILDKLKKELWAFPVTLICSKKVLYAGQNRNLACEYAKGDIFLTQDADDLAHHQRVEIVKYFFERYKLDFLMHLLRGVSPDEEIQVNLLDDFDKIERLNPKSHREAWKIRALTNGNLAIARHVFEKFKWPSARRAQDVKYNQTIFEHFDNRLVIKIVLQFYRNYLTTKEITKSGNSVKEIIKTNNLNFANGDRIGKMLFSVKVIMRKD